MDLNPLFLNWKADPSVSEVLSLYKNYELLIPFAFILLLGLLLF